MGYSPWGDKESDTIEQLSASFGSTYTKIGTIQRRLAWPLCKDDTQIREAFHIFYKTPRGEHRQNTLRRKSQQDPL